MVKNLPGMQEMLVQSLIWSGPLEEETETHSSILAWRTPWTEEPGGPQCTESQRVGQDSAAAKPLLGGDHSEYCSAY